ncbi:MAG: hypothetical protein ACRAVC_19185 [Trichormus sp.]
MKSMKFETSQTDWSRIDAMSDEDIDTSDIPPLSDEFFAKAQLRMPKSPVKVTVQLNAEFKHHTKQMNSKTDRGKI